MEWLNYHHLLYFWTTVKEGGLAQAAKKLRLAQSTISAQIHAFEDSMGEKLLVRSGRKLELTEMGHLVFRHAEEIFALGRELQETIKRRPTHRRGRLTIGIADVLPKLVTRRVLESALKFSASIRLICREDKPERLVAELANHQLDIVLSDSTVPAHHPVKTFHHLLGVSEISFLATKPLAQTYREGFPHSLNRAPVLLPTENTTLRRNLEQWFSEMNIEPLIVAEFEDSALLKVFGQTGEGIFPVPTLVAQEVTEQYHVEQVGTTPDVQERFYAITMERKITHPAVIAMSKSLRQPTLNSLSGMTQNLESR